MPASEKKQEHRDGRSQQNEEAQVETDIVEEAEELKEELDQLLDEIDEILEEDSQEFVENYIQRGGE